MRLEWNRARWLVAPRAQTVAAPGTDAWLGECVASADSLDDIAYLMRSCFVTKDYHRGRLRLQYARGTLQPSPFPPRRPSQQAPGRPCCGSQVGDLEALQVGGMVDRRLVRFYQFYQQETILAWVHVEIFRRRTGSVAELTCDSKVYGHRRRMPAEISQSLAMPSRQRTCRVLCATVACSSPAQ